jgi:hypothetical protein
MGLGFSPRQRAANRQHVTVYHPGSAAGDATEEWALVAFDKDATVHSVSWVPQTAVTGANTNTFHLNVRNLGSDGATTSTEIGNVDFVLNTDAAALQETDIVSTDTAVVAGDVVSVQRELVGTGLATPEGAFVVVFSVDDNA